VASWTAFLLVFNLVPAFPLDGGRLARAAAWRITGDRTRATRFAATIGRAFSYLLIGIGLYALLQGLVVTGIWAIFLGMILGSSARAALVQTAVTDHIGAVTVADIMDREPVAIEGDTPVAQAVDEYFLRYRWPWFPVVDRTGRFVGLLRQARAEEAERAGDRTIKVRDVMDLDALNWRVPETASLEALLGSEPLRQFGALMAVDEGGVLRGVVTLDQLRRALQSATAPPAV
jgi:CBS domain-containing protein